MCHSPFVLPFRLWTFRPQQSLSPPPSAVLAGNGRKCRRRPDCWRHQDRVQSVALRNKQQHLRQSVVWRVEIKVSDPGAHKQPLPAKISKGLKRTGAVEMSHLRLIQPCATETGTPAHGATSPNYARSALEEQRRFTRSRCAHHSWPGARAEVLTWRCSYRRSLLTPLSRPGVHTAPMANGNTSH